MNSWSDYLKEPKDLKLYVIHTGYVHMKGNIHFNSKSPGFKSQPQDERFNPVLAYLVVHPEKGYLLLDTGLHASFAQSGKGNFGWMLSKMIKTQTEKGKDVVSQLEKINISPSDIHNVIFSHLHPDHLCGLPAFQGVKNLTVFVDRNEIKAAKSILAVMNGYIKSHLAGFHIEPIEYKNSLQPFDKVCDFYGDGSLFIVSTPGHTIGHVSVILNMKSGPLFLTFDAAHRRANVVEEIPPKGDYKAALKSLQNIRSFLDQNPQTKVIFAHDPDQLSNLIQIPEYYS